MIIVTGATGHLGRLIVERLIERIPADQIGASVRDPAKVADLAARGVRVRAGDFGDPRSLPHAFEGATQLLIVSSNAAASGGDPLAQHADAIDAARAVGALRIVYTSHMGASATSAFPPMRDHHATEAMLERSGLSWTALRNGFYAASGLLLLGDGLTTGVVQAPADGKVAWTAHEDLAESAAVMLTSDGQYNGPTPPLTAERALDLAEVAEIASTLGRRVRRETITDDQLRERMTTRGMPPAAVEIALGLYRASRAGEFATVDPALSELIGRRPIDMREMLARKIAESRA